MYNKTRSEWINNTGGECGSVYVKGSVCRGECVCRERS